MAAQRYEISLSSIELFTNYSWVKRVKFCQHEKRNFVSLWQADCSIIQFIFNIQLQFNEFQIKCKASWFLQSTADLIHTGITLFQLFSPVEGKMEKQLWSLAAFLGECSRIVSQVLDSSDSSSNGNVTQILPANSRRTARNVSSAIERARSMLERSRNRGPCSRLNQRERLPDIPTLPIWLRVSLFVVLSPTPPIVIRSSRVILKF